MTAAAGLGHDAASPGAATAASAASAAAGRSTPMLRVSFRLAGEHIRLLAQLAADAGVSDSEFVRLLIHRAGEASNDDGAAGAPPSPKRKSRRPAQIVRTIALDPDARFLLLSSGRLLNQIARALNTDRLLDSPMTVVSFVADLLIVQDMLHGVGAQLLQMPSAQGNSTC